MPALQNKLSLAVSMLFGVAAGYGLATFSNPMDQNMPFVGDAVFDEESNAMTMVLERIKSEKPDIQEIKYSELRITFVREADQPHEICLETSYGYEGMLGDIDMQSDLFQDYLSDVRPSAKRHALTTLNRMKDRSHDDSILLNGGNECSDYVAEIYSEEIDLMHRVYQEEFKP